MSKAQPTLLGSQDMLTITGHKVQGSTAYMRMPLHFRREAADPIMLRPLPLMLHATSTSLVMLTFGALWKIYISRKKQEHEQQSNAAMITTVHSNRSSMMLTSMVSQFFSSPSSPGEFRTLRYHTSRRSGARVSITCDLTHLHEHKFPTRSEHPRDLRAAHAQGRTAAAHLGVGGVDACLSGRFRAYRINEPQDSETFGDHHC